MSASVPMTFSSVKPDGTLLTIMPGHGRDQRDIPPSKSVAKPLHSKRSHAHASDSKTDTVDSVTSTSHNSASESQPSQAVSYCAEGRAFYDDDDDYSSESEDSVKDRIDLSTLNIKGREQEVTRLHQVYSHVQQSGIDTFTMDATFVVMIQGVSGTGKSTLVKQFVQEVEAQVQVPGSEPKKKPYFLSGKCDELSGGDPFSAIVEALSGFATLLDQKESKKELERIQKAVQSALGPPEAQTLATMIPALRNVLMIRSEKPETEDRAVMDGAARPAISGSKENAWNRLKYIFQVFTRAISTKERPVIMFLDDLHWCDAASLELLEALLADKDLTHLMFIGAFRSDEVTTGHDLVTTLETIRNTQRLETIELTNLSFTSLHEFVADTLRKNSDGRLDETKTLAEAIHRKTSGNIFFAVQVLQELQRKGILLFSRMTFEWEWNLDEVKNLDNVLSDNVLEAVTAKIQSVPPLLQRALILAAYTRSTIDIDTIQHLLLKLDGHTITSTDLVKLLDEAVVEGLFSNAMGSKNYSFAHDRIQQASYLMISSGRARDELRLNLGLELYKMGMSPMGPSASSGGRQDDCWMLFVAADHLNGTAFQLRASLGHMFLIKLNLEVGERAASVAAYEMATKFLGLAMQCLLQGVKSPWETEYGMTLQIYRCTVDVALCQGHLEIGTAMGQRLLQNARTIEDKLQTQIALAKALGREQKARKSFDLSVDVLRDLNEYPRSLVGVQLSLVKDFSYVKRYLKKHSNEDILKLPFVTNERHIQTIELTSHMGAQAFRCGKKVEFLVAVLKALRLTFQHGLCGHSGVAMMGWAMFLDKLQDMEGVTRFSRLASDILQVTKAKEEECLQLFIANFWISAWKDPHEEVLKIFHRAHKSGMESGDFQTGLLSLSSSYHHEFLAGYSLAQLDRKYSSVVDKEDMYKVDFVKVMTVEQWLVVQHLRGTAQTRLNFPELESFGFQSHDGSDSFRVLYGCLARIQLGVYFGNCKFAETFVRKVAPLADLDCAHSPNSIRLFFGSLTYATLALETNQRRYRKKAKKYAKELRTMCKVKGMNSWHRYLLAEAHCNAEKATLGNCIQVKYDQAIAAALKTGHGQDAALGCQLVAEYFMSIPDKTLQNSLLVRARDLKVEQYLNQARDWYLQWGAKELVRHLEKKYGKYLPPSATSVDDEQSVDISSCADSIGLDDSFASLPRMPMQTIVANGTGDDVSLFSDGAQSAWRKDTLSSSKPHTIAL